MYAANPYTPRIQTVLECLNCSLTHVSAEGREQLQAQQLCHKVSAAFQQAPLLDTHSWGTGHEMLSVPSSELQQDGQSNYIQAQEPDSMSVASLCSLDAASHTSEGNVQPSMGVSCLDLSQTAEDCHSARTYSK